MGMRGKHWDRGLGREGRVLRGAAGVAGTTGRCWRGGSSVPPVLGGLHAPQGGRSQGELVLKPVVPQELHLGNGSGKTKYKDFF